MKVKIISCWFTTSYGDYTDGLRRALERCLGIEVGVIASNCGCGDSVEVNRRFMDRRCDYFELPHIYYYRSVNPVKRWLRIKGSQLMQRARAKQYLKRTGDAAVLHFQQILNAYGSVALFNWLSMSSKAARVVTVHELDMHQQDFPETNLKYNLADRIIVHTHEMKQSLISLGVDSERIDIVEHGVDISPVSNETREGIIFYGGHKLHSGKGLDVLFRAMALVKERLGPNTPLLKIHGHYGYVTPVYGLQCASEAGIADNVRWLNQISVAATISEYQRSLFCVLPFTGSFAGFPAVNAMANGLPVIGTRCAGLPEHLGEAGIWVEINDSEGLANAIGDLLSNEALRQNIAAKGRKRAETLLSWDTIARKTLDSYERAIRNKEQRNAGGVAVSAAKRSV
ncbi:MAG: glycosyltransferase family 4 protein [Sulfuricaulis sp.]